MDHISRLDDKLEKLSAMKGGVSAFFNGLTDKKSFVETGTFTSGTQFADGVCAEGEGVITGYATISGIPVYLFMQNFEAMRGSFSLAQAKKIKSVMDMAAKNAVPFISIIDSAGARLTEGVGICEGYAQLIKLAAGLKGVVPHVAVIKGACAGTIAAYAQLADIVIIDEKGYISTVSPSVVAAKADDKRDVNDIFGAINALKSGLAALSYKSVAELKSQITDLLSYISGEQVEGDNPNRTTKGLSESLTPESILATVCDKGASLELYAGYARSKAYFARVNGYPAGILAVNDKLYCGDFKLIKKFVNLLDNYNIPLITLVNSEGIAPDLHHETKGLATLASDAFLSVALSNNPKISVITGKAIGAAYSLLSSKSVGFDYTVAFENAEIAPISAEQAVNFTDIEYKTDDPVKEKAELVKTYTEREGNPFIAAKDGYIDNIICADDVRPYLAGALSMLM